MYSFCLGTVSKDFTRDEQCEISLSCTVYHYSIDHKSIKKEEILYIKQYIMFKNNIK